MSADAPPLTLRTERLDLVLATPALMAAALTGDEELALLLDAGLAAGWPPEFYDREALEYVLTRLSEGPEQAGWWMAFFLLREPERRLVGVGGYKGPPTPDGTVEFGYSVVREWQRRGLATEAAAEFLRHAVAMPAVTRVIAETMPERRASVRVLEKLGFTGAGEGSEPGVMRFEKLCRGTHGEERR